MNPLILEQLNRSAATIASLDHERIELVAEALARCLRNGGKIIILGNGGSASDAQHLAAELCGRFRMERPALPAMALDNISTITAIGNDFSYEEVFARQIHAYAREGDCVVGLSTSGASRNVLDAIIAAKDIGAFTIGMSGERGRLKDLVDLALIVPSHDAARVQEAYMTAGHIICDLVERMLFCRPAIFIDRDDTLAKDVPYCPSPEALEVFPGVGKAIRALNEAGYITVLITNQSGVARGFFDEETLQRIHQKLRDEIAKDGGALDGIYHCPHHPDAGCDCRKPNTGMVLKALSDLPIDLSRSVVVGDSDMDVKLGERLGCRTFRVSKDRDFCKIVEMLLREE